MMKKSKQREKMKKVITAVRYFAHGVYPCQPWQIKLDLVPTYFPHLWRNWRKGYQLFKEM